MNFPNGDLPHGSCSFTFLTCRTVEVRSTHKWEVPMHGNESLINFGRVEVSSFHEWDVPMNGMSQLLSGMA